MNMQFLTLSPALSDRQWQWEGRRMVLVATYCLFLLLWLGELVLAMVPMTSFLDFGARSESTNKKASSKKGLF
jgi:hypothetical protein